jgi:hypothetical protein
MPEARKAGKAGYVYLDTTSPASDPLLGVESWELVAEADVLDTTGMDSSGVRTKIAGLEGFAGTIVGTWDGGETQLVGAAPEIRKGQTLYFKLGLSATVNNFYAGSCVVKNVRTSVSVEGQVMYNIEFDGTGALTYPLA